MNKETYETLKRVLIKTRSLLEEKYTKRKRLSSDEVWERATLIRDIQDIKMWVDEIAKEYDEI